MVDVDAGSFLVIVTAAALAALLAGLIQPRLAIPVVVIELVLGIIIGPELLGLADDDNFIDFFSNLGLGMLFFFAGYEIDFERIRGRPLLLAVLGWVMIARACVFDRRPARLGRGRPVAAVHGLGDGHHRDRHAHSHPARRR